MKSDALHDPCYYDLITDSTETSSAITAMQSPCWVLHGERMQIKYPFLGETICRGSRSGRSKKWILATGSSTETLVPSSTQTSKIPDSGANK
jgi:hypothetical protein